MTDTTNPQAAWPSAVRDAFWTAVNAPTYDESTAATLAFAQLLTALAAASVPASAPTDGSVREQLLDALDFAYCRGLGYGTPEELLAAYDAAVLPAPADRAAILREAADWFDRYDVDSARELRRLADAVPQPAPPVEHCIHDRTVHHTHHKQAPVTGCPWCTTATSTEASACGPTPDQCDAETGEPCAKHEMEQSHNEGDHSLCRPADCEVLRQS
jgi:hypothetical protein